MRFGLGFLGCLKKATRLIPGTVIAGRGLFTLTGQDVNLRVDVLAADVTTFAMTGQAVTLTYNSTVLPAPDAPILTLTSDATDNTPDFTLAGDLVEGDTVRFQYSTDSGFAGASETTNTIDAAEDLANELDFSTGALADGTWYFRARKERSGHASSDWSNTQTETIATAGSGPVVVDAVGSEIYRSANTSASSSSVLTVGSGSNRALIATFSFGGVVSSISATWNGVAMTQLVTINNGANATVAIFGLRNPDSGANALAASWTGSAEVFVSAISFTGVNQTSDAAAFPNHASATGTKTVDVTSQTDDYVVCCNVNSFGTGLTGTEIFDDNRNGAVVNAGANYDVGVALATIGRTVGADAATLAIAAVDVSF